MTSSPGNVDFDVLVRSNNSNSLHIPVQIHHVRFIFKTKSLAPTVAMSFDCKVTTPTVMHSGHRYKESGPMAKADHISTSQGLTGKNNVDLQIQI